MTNRTILRYPGGKFRARKKIADMFDDSVQTVAAPFFGGGSVELELADRGKQVFAAELFEPVAYLWQQVKTDPQRLVDAVTPLLGQPRSRFYELQKELREGLDDPFEMAWRAFVVNRTSFSGSTLSGGIGDGARFTAGSVDQLLKVDLSKVEITQGDYWDVLFQSGQKYDGVYADPPYALDKGSNLYGNNGDTHDSFDHRLFAERMNQVEGRVVVSYNDCELVRDLFAGWEFIPVEWAYGMNKSKKSNEVLIVNSKVYKLFTIV